VVLGVPKHSKRGKDKTTDASHPGQSGLSNIQANGRQLRDVTRESLAALRGFSDPPSIFVRAGAARRHYAGHRQGWRGRSLSPDAPSQV
jgi:hypothetical protein